MWFATATNLTNFNDSNKIKMLLMWKYLFEASSQEWRLFPQTKRTLLARSVVRGKFKWTVLYFITHSWLLRNKLNVPVWHHLVQKLLPAQRHRFDFLIISSCWSQIARTDLKCKPQKSWGLRRTHQLKTGFNNYTASSLILNTEYKHII